MQKPFWLTLPVSILASKWQACIASLCLVVVIGGVEGVIKGEV